MMRISLICGLVLFGSVTSLAQEKAAINFTDHVLPIFREHCLACHNANDAEAGLAIDTYAGIMEGGGSGDAVMDGDPDSSKLYLVMTHAEEPVMPPDQDPLPKEQLDIIRQWIEGGLLETSGSKRRKRKGPSLSFSATDSSGKPEQIAMPETAWRVPVVSTTRHAASSAIATSPWAPLVAVGGQRQVALYHTETAELLGVLPYPEGIPQTLKFSRDGAYLLVAGGTHASKGTASLYDIRNGNRLLSVGDELDVVFGADINDNLSKIALGGPQRIVRIFDTSTGEILHELKKHTDWVYSVAYSPDGVLVATGDRSGGLHVWEAETGRLYLDLIGHKAAVRGISWRADSNVLVSASEDGTVKLWEMNSGNQLKSFNAHGGGATGVMMARDGRLVTCGKDRTVKLWDAAGKNIATMPAFPEPALEATITHDGKKIIGGDWSGQTIMWTIADTKQAVKLAADPPTLNQQQASWSTRVVELQKTLDAAKSNEAAVQKTLNDLAAKTKSFGDQKTQTIASQSKAQEELTSTEKQLAELNSQRASIAKMHEAATTSASDMAMKLKAMNTLLNAEKAKVGAATTQRDQSSNEMAKSADELSKLKQQQAKMKSDAVAPLAKIAERILDLQANQRVSSEAETEAETKRSSAEQQVNQLNQQVSDLDAEIKKVTESIAQATNDDEKKSLAEKQTSLQNKKPQLIARRMESENQIKRWTASRDESRNRVAEFAKQLVQLEQEEKAAVKTKQEAVGKIATLVKQQAEIQRKHDSFSNDVKKHEAMRVASAAKATELQTSVDSLTAQLQSKQQETKKLSDDLAGFDAKLKAIPVSIENLKKKLQAYTTSLSNLEKQIADNQKQVQDATAKIGEAKATTTDAQAKVDSASAKVKSLQTEIDAFAKFGQQLAAEAASTGAEAKTKREAVQPESARAEALSSKMTQREQELTQIAQTLAKLQSQLAGLQKAQDEDKKSLAVAQAKIQDLDLAAEKAESIADEKRERAEFFESAYGD